jgi:hypothetical protein
MSHSIQKIYNPTDYTFNWTEDGWYTFDCKAGQKQAMKARNEEAKKLVKDGWKVTKFSLPDQLLSFGGIGSGKNHIEVICNCYGLNAYK